MGLVAVMDAALGWMLALPMWLSLLILAAFLVLVMTLVQKFFTDQEEMGRLKKQIKDAQQEMKKHRDNPKKAAKVQQQAMEANMRYTMKSFRTTLYTIIPLIIIIAWVNMHFSYGAVLAGEPVPVTMEMSEAARLTLEASENVSIQGEATKETLEREASWLVSAPDGRHTLTFTTQDGASVTRELIVGERPLGQFILLVYTVPGDGVADHEAPFSRSEIDYPKATPLGDFSIGSYQPGWLMTYFIFSIFLSIGLRRLLKVH